MVNPTHSAQQARAHGRYIRGSVFQGAPGARSDHAAAPIARR